MSVTHRRQPSRLIIPGLPPALAIYPPGQKKNTNAGRLTGRGAVFLASQTFSGVFAADFSLVAYPTFKMFEFVLIGILPVTDNNSLSVAWSTDNGGTILNTNYAWTMGIHREGVAYASAGAASATLIPIVANSLGNAAAEGYSGEMKQFPALAGRTSLIHRGSFISSDATPALYSVFGGGSRLGVVNWTRFIIGAGNMSGTIQLYGYD